MSSGYQGRRVPQGSETPSKLFSLIVRKSDGEEFGHALIGQVPGVPPPPPQIVLRLRRGTPGNHERERQPLDVVFRTFAGESGATTPERSTRAQFADDHEQERTAEAASTGGSANSKIQDGKMPNSSATTFGGGSPSVCIAPRIYRATVIAASSTMSPHLPAS
ncbi:hypothetical protein [Amycolatopsis decaplanina]|uniref:Uncharacterized protein n=1 Tax=Amycolatopsis decaplanina DSM 44594 TaxID=1284240 RepID=M2XGW2_9PSEU|nr:hypothetical protein [Amycolatopsis decaplanina]EME60236.1 hypothetical protein H074_14457 [Amycolatopsis decaplanina DSM 44594]